MQRPTKMMFLEASKIVTRKILGRLIFFAALMAGGFASAQPVVVGWGEDTYGQTDIPPGLTNVAAIAAGANHSLTLQSNGIVVAWGDDTYGQIDIPAGLSNVVAIAAGANHSLALQSNGIVVAWGDDTYGQTDVPAGLSNVVAIAAGEYYNLALESNSTVFAWGDNGYGQTSVPSGLSNVVAIAAGGFHCLALEHNGSVVSWGNDYFGETNPPAVLSGVKAVAGGDYHSLVLESNGTVIAWGANFYGQTNVPAGLTNVVAIAAGYNDNLALTSNGTIVVWGAPYGNTDALLRIFNVSAFVTGRAHALALAYDDDFFADSRPIAGTNIMFQGSNSGATGEAGEPPMASGLFEFGQETNSVWYTWTAPFSGGVVIDISRSFNAPVVSVYTNNTLATLGGVVVNGSSFGIARAAFTAISNVTYHVSIAGSALGTSDEGSFTTTLVENPPPANDLFVNRSVITNVYFATAGSFLGASQEAGEPVNNPSYPQTLWWSWTAPTNIGNSSIQVRLMADSINWTPSIGVYTGGVVNTLALISVNTQNSGFNNGQPSPTSTATFTAIPGVTYQISVAGYGGDPGGNVISPRFGNYRFCLNATGYGLLLTNFTVVNNGDNTYNFSGTTMVANSGPAASNPLQIRVFYASGVSVLGPDSGYATTNLTYCSTNSIGALAAGQTVSVTITGNIPAAAVDSQYMGDGFGAYAELDEQPIPNTWFTADRVLIGFADWPDLSGNNGPGGGVIRLDPDYIGSSPQYPLHAVSIFGPTIIFENSTTNYAGKAVYEDGSIYSFTNTAWSSSNSKFTITTNGVFTAGTVTSNTIVSLSAPYSSSGLLHNATTNVTVVSLPPPALSGAHILANGNFAVTLSGSPGRTLVVDAATNLTLPVVWTPLTTNLIGTNGLFNYTNSPANNLPRRFFRAREM